MCGTRRGAPRDDDTTPARSCFDSSVADDGGQISADDLLAEARRTIVRLTPAEALERQFAGAVLVDIRSERVRERDGIVPGSVHVPRTVLEWRADLASPWRNPCLTDTPGPLILICEHGWSSSLAAATLRRLGREGAGDVIGGFEAWQAAGLPVAAVPLGRLEADGALPGMGRPDGQPGPRDVA